jgi:hypothetical protein
MACTKETYTATATWTASQLAQLFEDAFIDAGLMTAWFDSFLSGSIENRILEVTYDGTKAYGKTYYWFMFSTVGVFLHVATGWNAATDQPTGTQYLDFFATTTNSTANHLQLIPLGTANTVELVRYTSGVDTDQSWFVIKSSTSRRGFSIVNDAMTIQPWIDLGKGFYNGYARTNLTTSGQQGLASWQTGATLRRDIVMGCGLVGSTTISHYTSSAEELLIGYRAVGHLSSNAGNFDFPFAPYIFLPVGFSATNPAYTSNSNPVFHSLTWNPYITETLPADFGLTFHYATNTFSQGDTFVVSAGTEEWEVLDFAANASAVTGASPLFLARMV